MSRRLVKAIDLEEGMIIQSGRDKQRVHQVMGFNDGLIVLELSIVGTRQVPENQPFIVIEEGK